LYPKPATLQGASLLAFILDKGSRVVNLIVVASVVELLIFRVITANSRPLFSGAGNLADLASDLSVGYVSGWVFYYLVSWRPHRQSRNLIILQAGPRALNVSGTSLGLLEGLRKCANDSSMGPISIEGLSLLGHSLRTTGPAQLVNLNGQTLTVVDLMGYHQTRARDFTASLDSFTLYLDPELLAFLTQINTCVYFSQVDLALRIRADQDLLFLVPSMYEYFVMTDNLRAFVVGNYGGIIDGRPLSTAAVATMRAASEPVTWRSGSVSPWEARQEPPP
jgi:hypothetical protein